MDPLFSPEWFAAGIITDVIATDFARYARAEPNRSARHWRWVALRDWSEEREPLTAEQCRAIFALGEAEPDLNLGTAITCHALYQRACPADVREAAKRSSRAPVRHAAEGKWKRGPQS